MATLQDLLDDLNDRLNDANNAAGAGEATKIRWINRGISAMWPRIYRTVSDATITIAADDYEYDIPAAVGDESEIFRVEIESASISGLWSELDGYDIVPVLTGRVLQLPSANLWVGSSVRITAAVPLSALVATTDDFDGRRIHEELPVWYAMGLAAGRRLEDRIDYTRYTTTAAQNGVDINEVMNASQFAFAMFESMIERMAMPLPPSIG